MIGGVWGEEYQRDEEGEKRERGVGGGEASPAFQPRDGWPAYRPGLGGSFQNGDIIQRPDLLLSAAAGSQCRSMLDLPAATGLLCLCAPGSPSPLTKIK